MTQGEALKILKTGANIFLTGEPGSGKTHTVNEYISYLRSAGIEPAITASTGIAATHIGGMTIHAWSGIGIRRNLSNYDLDHISQNRNTVRRIAAAKVLIIDEISMLSARTLSMVEVVCRELRHSYEPFGGLQVILVGDFFQLPPVSKREEKDESKEQEIIYDSEPQKEQLQEFAFSSPAWKALNPLICYLHEQHRQEDALFLEFLGAIRRGVVGEDHKVLLRKRYSPRPQGDITELYSYNADVDEINNKELSKLQSDTKIFTMESYGPDRLVEALKRGCLSPELLALKVGARVMFTKNDIIMHRYANGTLGVVTSFSEHGSPVVTTKGGKVISVERDGWHIEENGRPLASIMQMPLRLAWAMTVHKSQGMSLDAAHMDLSGTFEYGQGYVALSRVRTLSGLSLAGLNQKALEVHPQILKKDIEFRNASDVVLEKFDDFNEEEISTLHTNFIKACGGTPGIGRRVSKGKNKKEGTTYALTKNLVAKKFSLKEMAKERGMTEGTILSHLEKLTEKKEIKPEEDLDYLRGDKKHFQKIQKVLVELYKKDKKMPLTPAKEILGDGYGYDEIRLARIFVNI